MKLLFHCCCTPCTAGCLPILSAEKIAPVLFWYNPNIHPYTEYISRRDALTQFAARENLELQTIDEYGLYPFIRRVYPEMEKGPETEGAARCLSCYRMRLERAALYAAENGFDAFSTSLLVSPYQQHDAIREIGEELATQHGISFLYRDFRNSFREGQAKARALQLYMQKYCGCVFSIQGQNHIKTPCSSVVKYSFQRLALITGEEALEKIARTNVLVFGLGGVGSWCAEALARSGIGKIGLVDFDTVCESNINRQVQATSRTIGLSKARALRERLLEINPRLEVNVWEKVFTRESAGDFGIEKADYVIDAIDSLGHKLDLIEMTCTAGIRLFSSMGMAQKIDPTRIKTSGIWETRGCPLARRVRHGLSKRGFSGSFTAVYSEEQFPRQGEARHGEIACEDGQAGRKKINGSVVTVTASAGMVLASLVLRDIVGQK
jgi:tRNA A37 threonylcarbamoyladenosine dehydratase/predicted adenine nucleotide alpha hydrolase (AANH) superfamily ATPase